MADVCEEVALRAARPFGLHARVLQVACLHREAFSQYRQLPVCVFEVLAPDVDPGPWGTGAGCEPGGSESSCGYRVSERQRQRSYECHHQQHREKNLPPACFGLAVVSRQSSCSGRVPERATTSAPVSHCLGPEQHGPSCCLVKIQYI